MPLETVLSSGNPELFRELTSLYAAEEALTARAGDAAEGLARRIRAGGLPRNDTKALGRIVSRLRRGARLTPRDYVALIEPDYLQTRVELRAIEDTHMCLAAEEARLQQLVAAEPRRAAAALWARCRDDEAVSALLAHRDPDLLARCRANGDEPCYWTGKRGRHRLGYLLEIASRAAFRTIPRDWHAYVTVLPADEPAQVPVPAAEFAAVGVENVHSIRRRIAQTWPADAEAARLGVAPLRWGLAGKIVFCVTDLDAPLEVSEVALKRSDLLSSLLEILEGRALRYSELVDAIAPRLPAEDLAIFGGFVGHLVKLGILTAARDPLVTVTPWQAAGGPGTDRRAMRASYVDVYGRGNGSFSITRALALQDSFRLLARLSLLVETEAERPLMERTPSTEAEQGVLELVRNRILSAEIEAAADPVAALPEARRDWPVSGTLDTPYQQFLSALRQRVVAGRTITIGAAELDAAGAPDWHWNWPTDVMVRMAHPTASYVGAFDEAFAAGSMEARFVAGARRVGLGTPQHAAYLKFLRAVESRIGQRFIELLFPPLSEGAANAVRRPAYVRDWTGDPDSASYYDPSGSGLRFVGLGALRVRSTPRGNRIVHGDRILFPMYHATRLPIAPWHLLVDVLLNAAPYQMRWSPRRLRRHLDAFPDMRFAPRVEMDGGLVVGGAQWRLSGEIDWHPRDSSWQKLRSLGRLKQRLGLPRIVFLSPAPGRRPAPCDLESVSALEVLDALRGQQDPIAIEMLPGVEETLIRTGVGAKSSSLASSTMLRFPMDIEPECLAEAIAPRLL